MYAAFVITLREGLEASLIVGILLAYLTKRGAGQLHRHIWTGTLLAVLATVVAGGLLQILAVQFEGQGALFFEAAASTLAVGVLTWMVLWMQRQSRRLRGDLERRVDAALSRNELWALVLLAFSTVVREGLETVLFLFTLVRSAQASLIVGGLLGLGLAATLVYALFRTSARFNLRAFFIVTGVLLIFIAAGLVGHTVRSLQEAGVLPILAGRAWDTTAWIGEDTVPGGLLHAFLGYSARPNVLEVLAYMVYLGTFLASFARALLLGPRGPRTERPVTVGTG
jgi:high-affinity iron transporter